MTKDATVERLDRIVAVLQLAHYDEIERARNRIRKDPTNAALLDHTAGDTVKAGVLTDAVAKETGESKRTVSRRLADLVDRGVLIREGSGPTIAYRATGLV